MLPSELVALTRNTITDREVVMAELEQCRRDGYAKDNEDNSEGIRCFAVAVTTGLPGTPTNAISVSIPTFRLGEGIERQAVASSSTWTRGCCAAY